MQGDGARLGSRLIDRIQKRRAANCSGRIDTSRLQPYRPDVSQAVHLTVQTSTAKSKKWTAPLQRPSRVNALVALSPVSLLFVVQRPHPHTPPTPVRNFHAQVVWRPANGPLQSSCAVRALAPSPIHNRDGCLLVHIWFTHNTGRLLSFARLCFQERAPNSFASCQTKALRLVLAPRRPGVVFGNEPNTTY